MVTKVPCLTALSVQESEAKAQLDAVDSSAISKMKDERNADKEKQRAL